MIGEIPDYRPTGLPSGDEHRRINCVECGRPFMPPPTRGRHRLTCSDDCKRARRLRSVRLSQRRVRQRQEREAARLFPDDPPPSGRRAIIGPRHLLELQSALRGIGPRDPARRAVIRDVADRLGVHERTVERATRLGPPERVVVGRWEAWFAAQVHGGVPVMLTEWRGITTWDDSTP